MKDAEDMAKKLIVKDYKQENYITEDVQIVRHGHWTLREGDLAFWDRCSECGKDVLHQYPHFNYCPHCGARMDGKQDED